ncbi:hypothetical protein [Ottowia thiooxydans]|uniref:Membrane protein n=1 Tax=Ottowia thiooxydans TaxID=219182 RepID=A0ABV2Q5F2_9BURK
MSNVAIHSFLKNVLLLDAVTGVAVAALQLALPQLLSSWLGLAVPLLVGSAFLLLGYVALLLWMAFAGRVGRWVLQFLVWANVAWALACLALAIGMTGVTKLGMAYLAVQAITVLAFAGLQWHLGREGRAKSLSVQGA